MSEELEEYPREPLDTDSIFAKFTRVQLAEFEVLALSRATIVCNPSVPASEVYLTYVSQCDCYVSDIREFCLGLANAMSKARKSRKNGREMPAMIAYNESWGRHAVSDAMVIAFVGKEHAPIVSGDVGRAAMLGIDPKTYRRVRDFLAGVLTITVMDYRLALEWAMGRRRDTELQARWGRVTGQPFPAKGWDDTMGRESHKGFSEGCFRSEPTDESDSLYRSNNMMLHVGFSDDELWRPH